MAMLFRRPSSSSKVLLVASANFITATHHRPQLWALDLQELTLPRSLPIQWQSANPSDPLFRMPEAQCPSKDHPTVTTEALVAVRAQGLDEELPAIGERIPAVRGNRTGNLLPILVMLGFQMLLAHRLVGSLRLTFRCARSNRLGYFAAEHVYKIENDLMRKNTGGSRQQNGQAPAISGELGFSNVSGSPPGR